MNVFYKELKGNFYEKTNKSNSSKPKAIKTTLKQY